MREIIRAGTFSKFVFGSRGFGLVGQLLAAGSAMSSFLLVVLVSQYTVRTYNYIQTGQLMVSAEGQLLNFYHSTEALRNLAPEMNGHEGSLSARDIEWQGAKIGRIGGELALDADGKPCATSGNACVVKIETAVLCSKKTIGSDCSATYRISALKGSLINLGVTHNNVFSAADYSLPLSYEVTMREMANYCDQNTNYFASGLIRESGKMLCLRRSQNSCASGQIAKGLKYDAGLGSLEPVCEETQKIACPPNYVLQNFNILSLEEGRARSGSCVFVGQKTVPWKNPPAAAASVSGTFCPPQFYKTEASCVVTVTSQWNGACPYSCNCDKDGENCGTCYSPASPSNVGAYTLSFGAGPTASCSINPGSQSCGAGWTGVVTMNGTCVLTEPETKGIL